MQWQILKPLQLGIYIYCRVEITINFIICKTKYISSPINWLSPQFRLFFAHRLDFRRGDEDSFLELPK